MTILATGIGYIPQFRPTQRLCRHCLDPYMPRERGDRYCGKRACQEAKIRRAQQVDRKRQK